MRKIDFQDWALYLIEISNEYCEDNKQALELGAGTCLVSQFIEIHFDKLFVTDSSLQMLNKSSNSFRKIVCDMRLIPFKVKYDFIYSIFDSINYLTDEMDLRKLFYEVSIILKKGGVFTFDISLENNSLNNIKSLNRSGRYKGLKFLQKSNYDSNTMIHSNSFVIRDNNGNEFNETHNQKIYKFEDIFKIIDTTNLYVVECYDAFSYNSASSDSERAQFILKLRNS